MPPLKEVQHYFIGLWLLVQRDPKGFQYLDISERGVLRSFWAILWCFPATAISWVWWRNAYLISVPKEPQSGPLFVLHLAMLEVANWVFPVVLIGVMCLVLGLGNRFLAIVVTSNWLAVPFSYIYGLIIAMVIFIPGSAAMASLLWLGLMLGLVFSLMRIFSMICGKQPLMIATLILVFVVPTMLLSDLLEQYLGVYLF